MNGKRLTTRILMSLLGAIFLVPLMTQNASAYTQGRLIDDQVFDNSGTMNESQIQDFLSSKGPCLVNYQSADFDYSIATGWTYGSNVSAAHIIFKASQEWGLNPQVILTTLQKEQSLITGTSCDSWRYNSAMGYACPDSGGCDTHYAGFTKQVLWGSWQLKFNKERSLGNTGWNGDGNITYVGFMTQGSYKRCDSCVTISYDGNATIDGQVIHLENGATASLYTYTPHLGQSFPGLFTQWFGPPTADSAMGQPLHRLYRRANDRHFYTLNAGERSAAIQQGYTYEAISYYVSYGQAPDLVPIYRLYNPKTDYHFYTISPDERNRATGIGFVYEGIGFYASPMQMTGTVPVFRLVNKGTGMHLFTINPSERDTAMKNNYLYEGISYYAGLGQ